MKTLYTLLLGAMTIALVSASAASNSDVDKNFPNGSPDGRFGTPCSSGRTFATDQPICAVPFARLIAVPEKFDGKTISLIGFLVDNHGFPMIYPSPENFVAQTSFDHVFIGDGIPTALQEKLKHGVWVEVIGKFDAKYMGKTLSLGAIWHINSIREQTNERPERPPAPTIPKL